jgi:hypothetical protein
MSPQTLFHTHFIHHSIQAFQYFIVLFITQAVAGSIAFSKTGLANHQIAPQISHQVIISHFVVSFPFSSIGIQAQVTAHTQAHTRILHHRVLAIQVGQARNNSQAQVIKLQAFHQIVLSKSSFLIFLISSACCLNSSLLNIKLHKFHICSATKAGQETHKSSIFLPIFCNIVASSYLFSFTAFIARFISTQDFAIRIKALLSCGDNFVSHHFSILFSFIASSAFSSEIQAFFILSRASVSFTNKLVGHLFGFTCVSCIGVGFCTILAGELGV